MLRTRNEIKKTGRDGSGKKIVDYLEVVVPGNSCWARFQRRLRSFFLISSRNRRAFGYFRSKEAIRQERKRQLHLHPYMIHPFSNFRVCWEVLIMILLVFTLFAIPVFGSYPDFMASYLRQMKYVSSLSSLLVLDILLHFLTGRCKTDTKEVTFNPKIVAMEYVKNMLLWDILGCFPVVIAMQKVFNTGSSAAAAASLGPLWLFRQLSCFRWLLYYKNLIEVLNISFMKERCFRLCFLLLLAMHTAACLQYYVFIWANATTGTQAGASTWLGKLTLLKLPLFGKYIRSVHRVAAVTAMVCLTFRGESDTEQNFSLALVIVGQILSFILIANAMHIIKSSRVSSGKYEEATTHLQQYLAEKKLPRHLKNRVQDFYDFRYHKSAFHETEIMETISETLRQDILVFKCKKLLDNALFFSTLPEVLKSTLVKCMQNKFYQPDDTIIKLKDNDNCMYFIKTGTVAVYSSSGKEICHLEDGNHFGEISLMLAGVLRVSSVVAIENCELYRLERGDFLDAMEPYPDILASMKSIAEERLSRTRNIDVVNED